ncbi:MAG: hypothetical protein AAF960_28795 [Bacteroidota bacterium]
MTGTIKSWMSYIWGGLLAGLFLVAGCQSEPLKISPAFYHWQTNFDLAAKERATLKQLKVQTIYPKCFDVDWDFKQDKPVALASINWTASPNPDIQIVPTVFITNRTLVQITPNELPKLAQKIVDKLAEQTKVVGANIAEYQFDCDWNKTTQLKYFSLLRLIQERVKEKSIYFSATIRLHQIKYVEKTGVPPVRRGMLMYYNMGKVQDFTTENSILDNDTGRQYLDRLNEYPLPLDVALPLFQWGVLFRNDHMIKLINQLTAADLADRQRFDKIAKNRWRVVKSTYLNGYYLYENDLIRIEKVEKKNLLKAATLLQKRLKKESRNIVFYHLDEAVLQPFDTNFLREVLQVFSPVEN